ncbi:MAG TPA: penicillin-binding protein [Bacteroidales bacterium]|nr:penicillin-binding protein [Bacteroidales bacterium]
MKKLIVLLLLSAVASSAIAQKTDKRLKKIEKELEEVLETFKAPGFAVAVVEKDKILYSKGFGYSDYDNKIPADANTLFAIGSCTKAFTTSLIGMLEKEDKLSLDKSPSEYIPGFKFSTDEMNNGITIKDLMSHSTGLPRHDFSWYFFPGESKKSLLLRVAYQKPFTGVREQWYYNNFMFLAQGVIIEELTDRSWEENVREKIFKPLGMTRSNLSIDELEKSENAALGYRLKDSTSIEKMDYYRIAKMSPAGSINSSVNEMSKWVITWINGGKYQDREIIPGGFVTQAISSHKVVLSALPDKDRPDLHLSNYGYGWFISSYKGHYRVEHGGNIDGFSASTCLFPADSIGIIVLANQNASVVPGVVCNIVSDRMLGVRKDNWTAIQKKQIDDARKAQKEAQESPETVRKTGTVPSHDLKEYTGSYENEGYGSFELALSNDSLYAILPLNKYWLKHFHYNVFEPFEVSENGIDTTAQIQLKFNFTTGNNGDISGLNIKMEPMLDPLFFKRTPEIVDLDKETLELYAGEYDLAGTPIKVYLKGEDKLYVFVPGQPEYELISIGDDKFNIKVLDGFSVQFVKEDSEITGLKFIQPNGVFKAKKKQ